jgi:hypothetical protein
VYSGVDQMILSLNEIRKRAIEFAKEWEGEESEKAERQTFWNDFFNVFDISRRRVASFEKPVIKLDERKGYIDLFWKGVRIVEHKSKGKDLDKAYSQALDYFNGLSEEELPKYVIVSDFARFRIYDLDNDDYHDFNLIDLKDNIQLFYFMTGHTKHEYKDEDPVNIKAAEFMGKLHDFLKDDGYTGHALEIFLVRIMFCLFADDTGIFEKDFFTYYIDKRTKTDGSDLGVHLSQIFQVLNAKTEDRQKSMDEDLLKFPYVNGSLFEETLPFPSFTSDTRKILLSCCHFDWSKVSPAIFGSMFQSVMDKDIRRDFGAHYTSEQNIQKAIKPLFLDDLYNEFKKSKNDKRKLKKLLEKISNIKILDPACGCGNFLIISYRELRLLEIEIHKQLSKISGATRQMVLDVSVFNKGINVDSMYGIEIEEFPARIAEVALWLTDHQMNIRLSEEFGLYYTRLPLTTSPNIINDNALRLDWKDIIKKEDLNYITGNPPFIPKKRRTCEQNEDMELVCGEIKNHGLLDYVCSWYVKAIQYIQETDIKVAFVSTNSITQGEQVGVLWEYLLKNGVNIHFAHRTFRWFNKARGKAQVYVVIIGFSLFDIPKKRIFDYETPKSDPMELKAKQINPYLIEYKDILIKNRTNPICDVPHIVFGNMPNDKGNFLFSAEDKNDFLKSEPAARKYIKPFISAKQFINNIERWCLWLKDISPSEINKLPGIKKRVENVKQYRLKSNRETTRKLADTPYLFGEIRQPNDGRFILIPRHSSENRKYIPMAFFSHKYIAADSCLIIPNATLYHLGVLMSTMHMVWVRQMCGRIKSDYRYSNKLVYNNFPWPENPSQTKINKIEECAQIVLDVRKEFLNSSLADLYDPLSMPKRLLKAHQKLDKAVIKAYGGTSFENDLLILGHLFELFNRYTLDEK